MDLKAQESSQQQKQTQAVTNSAGQQVAVAPEVKAPGGVPMGEALAQQAQQEQQAQKPTPVVHRQPGVDPNKLYVQVSSPERTLFDGEAKSLSSFNDRGPFDILPQHENFISVIQQNLVVFNTQNQPQEYLLKNGVMRVTENRVDVFIGF